MAAMKQRFPCYKSHKYVHWANDNNLDGTLRYGARCLDNPANSRASKSVDSSHKKGSKQVMIEFNSTLVKQNGTIECNNFMSKATGFKIGPLVDDVPPTVQFVSSN